MPEYVPEVTRVEVAGRKLRLTSLDKVMYPSTETTKGEVLAYYAQIAPLMLPHVADRPVTRVRWPHGVEDQMFFEKNLPSGAPSWLPRVPIDDVTYPLITDLADLTYLVNLNSLEVHVPQWTVDDDGERRNPDRLVIDLDPGKPAGLHECAKVALLVRDRLADARPRDVPGDLGQQGDAALRGARRRPHQRPGARPRDAARAGDDQEVPGPGAVEDDQVAAARARSSSTGARTSRPRPRSAPTRCAAASCPASPRHAPGTRSSEGAEEPDALRQLMFDEVLERVERDGDLSPTCPEPPTSPAPGSASADVARDLAQPRAPGALDAPGQGVDEAARLARWHPRPDQPGCRLRLAAGGRPHVVDQRRAGVRADPHLRRDTPRPPARRPRGSRARRAPGARRAGRHPAAGR